MRLRVLFLCTGNSCRSQMAEAIVNHDLAESWEAYSAGMRPTSLVHPAALEVLQEIGIRHQGRSKSVDEFRGEAFDVVMTLCDPAAEACPAWLGKGQRLHVGFPDPASAPGTEAERLAGFRSVRDEIRRRVPAALQPTTHKARRQS